MRDKINLRLGGKDHEKLFTLTYAKRKEAALKGGQKVTPLEHAAKVLETKLRRLGHALGELVHLRLEWVNNKSQLKHLKESFRDLDRQFKELKQSDPTKNTKRFEEAIDDARKVIVTLREADADETKTLDVETAVEALANAVKELKAKKEVPPSSETERDAATAHSKASKEPSPKPKPIAAPSPKKSYADAVRSRSEAPPPVPTSHKTVVSSRVPTPLPGSTSTTAHPAAEETQKESGGKVVERGREERPEAVVAATGGGALSISPSISPAGPAQIHPEFLKFIQEGEKGKEVNLENPLFQQFIRENLGERTLSEASKLYGNANFHLQVAAGGILVTVPKELGKAQKPVPLLKGEAQKEASQPKEAPHPAAAQTVNARSPTPPASSTPPAPTTKAQKEEPSARGGITGRRGLFALAAALLGGTVLAAGKYLYDATASSGGTGAQMEPFIEREPPPTEGNLYGQSTFVDPAIAEVFPPTYEPVGLPTLAIGAPPSLSTGLQPTPAPTTAPQDDLIEEQVVEGQAPEDSGSAMATALGWGAAATALGGAAIFLAVRVIGREKEPPEEGSPRSSKSAPSAPQPRVANLSSTPTPTPFDLSGVEATPSPRPSSSPTSHHERPDGALDAFETGRPAGEGLRVSKEVERHVEGAVKSVENQLKSFVFYGTPEKTKPLLERLNEVNQEHGLAELEDLASMDVLRDNAYQAFGEDGQKSFNWENDVRRAVQEVGSLDYTDKGQFPQTQTPESPLETPLRRSSSPPPDDAGPQYDSGMRFGRGVSGDALVHFGSPEGDEGESTWGEEADGKASPRGSPRGGDSPMAASREMPVSGGSFGKEASGAELVSAKPKVGWGLEAPKREFTGEMNRYVGAIESYIMTLQDEIGKFKMLHSTQKAEKARALAEFLRHLSSDVREKGSIVHLSTLIETIESPTYLGNPNLWKIVSSELRHPKLIRMSDAELTEVLKDAYERIPPQTQEATAASSDASPSAVSPPSRSLTSASSEVEELPKTRSRGRSPTPTPGDSGLPGAGRADSSSRSSRRTGRTGPPKLEASGYGPPVISSIVRDRHFRVNPEVEEQLNAISDRITTLQDEIAGLTGSNRDKKIDELIDFLEGLVQSMHQHDDSFNLHGLLGNLHPKYKYERGLNGFVQYALNQSLVSDDNLVTVLKTVMNTPESQATQAVSPKASSRATSPPPSTHGSTFRGLGETERNGLPTRSRTPTQRGFGGTSRERTSSERPPASETGSRPKAGRAASPDAAGKGGGPSKAASGTAPVERGPSRKLSDETRVLVKNIGTYISSLQTRIARLGNDFNARNKAIDDLYSFLGALDENIRKYDSTFKNSITNLSNRYNFYFRETSLPFDVPENLKNSNTSNEELRTALEAVGKQYHEKWEEK